MTSYSTCLLNSWIFLILCITRLSIAISPEIQRSNYSNDVIEQAENTIANCSNHTNNDNNLDDQIDQSLAVCMVHGDEYHIKCRNGIEKKWLENPHCDIITLSLISWPDKTLPIKYIFKYFPLLKQINIYNSSFSKFDENFPSTAVRLKKIIINGLKNTVIKEKIFSQLPNLEILDLKHNLLSHIRPDFINSMPKLTNLYLKDNKWNCSHDGLEWLIHLETSAEIRAKSKIADFNHLTCSGNMYPGKPLHLVMDLKKKINRDCPTSCNCKLSNLVRDPNSNELVPLAEVDCRHKGLVAMPSILPSFKTILMLHGNNIKDVQPLVENNVYKSVTDLYLDDNLLTNVAPLEGAEWLNSFILFSLRGNNISQLPTYAFDHAFESNLKMIRVYLGNNPWQCNCHFIPGFQEFIIKYNKVIMDVKDIKCCNSDQPDVSKAEISTLSRTIICRQSEEIIHTVDIINIFLASLLLLVIGNFAYDYYWFKKTGKLPWIATKIP